MVIYFWDSYFYGILSGIILALIVLILVFFGIGIGIKTRGLIRKMRNRRRSTDPENPAEEEGRNDEVLENIADPETDPEILIESEKENSKAHLRSTYELFVRTDYSK